MVPTWESNDTSTTRGKTGESYCIIMPPPNVTGQLHISHALDVTTQDALIRFKRMKGYKTLSSRNGPCGDRDSPLLRRCSMARELQDTSWRKKFLDKTWEWKEKHGGVILTNKENLVLVLIGTTHFSPWMMRVTKLFEKFCGSL